MLYYLRNGWSLIKESFDFLREGYQCNLFGDYLNAYLKALAQYLNQFRFRLSTMSKKHDSLNGLQPRIKGLHDLLPEDLNYSYSILIPLENPSSKRLKSCLLSACIQTPKRFEILIGCKETCSDKCLEVIQDVDALHPGRIQFCNFNNTNNEPLLNLLAQKSQMNFLLFVDQEDWIRTDLLYRYEQCLRAFDDRGKVIVTCSENTINDDDHFVPRSSQNKTMPTFPYLFQSTFSLRGVLIPKQLWTMVKGLRKEFEGAQTEDLYLRLDLAGGIFTSVPFNLYSRRKGNVHKEPFDKKAFIQSVEEYAHNKGLKWDFSDGDHQSYIHPKPQITKKHKIQVLIPFKDQKDMTLRCIASVQKQKDVDVIITAIDNRSHDHSIAIAIRELGGEVISIDEPFNYSRLNNQAVERSTKAKDCDLLLFLNNDVELEENAILEMVRWIDQPDIGMVGARLHFPDGRLQHGGIELDSYKFPDKLYYDHIEKFCTYNHMVKSRAACVVDGVTAACALIKKDLFLALGGFDEIWYPIANSDTNLAEKIKMKGLKCFYTPYAAGIHHESVSRKYILEDIDPSRWLHELVSKKRNVS